jgi:hypothetical protein
MPGSSPAGPARAVWRWPGWPITRRILPWSLAFHREAPRRRRAPWPSCGRALTKSTPMLDPDGVSVAQSALLEEHLAGDAEKVAHRHADALFGQHRVHLGFQTRTQRPGRACGWRRRAASCPPRPPGSFRRKNNDCVGRLLLPRGRIWGRAAGLLRRGSVCLRLAGCDVNIRFLTVATGLRPPWRVSAVFRSSPLLRRRHVATPAPAGTGPARRASGRPLPATSGRSW